MDGWASAARGLAATALDIGQTRLTLAATELEEERLRLARQALCITAAFVFAALGIGCAALAFALLAPPADRPCGGGGRRARGVGGGAPGRPPRGWGGGPRAPPLQATLEELRKDCAVIAPRSP